MKINTNESRFLKGHFILTSMCTCKCTVVSDAFRPNPVNIKWACNQGLNSLGYTYEMPRSKVAENQLCQWSQPQKTCQLSWMTERMKNRALSEWKQTIPIDVLKTHSSSVSGLWQGHFYSFARCDSEIIADKKRVWLPQIYPPLGNQTLYFLAPDKSLCPSICSRVHITRDPFLLRNVLCNILVTSHTVIIGVAY